MIFIRQLKNNTYKQSNHTTRRKGASLMKIEQNRNWRRAREEKKIPWPQSLAAKKKVERGSESLPAGETRRAGDGSFCGTESSVGTKARGTRRKNQKSDLADARTQQRYRISEDKNEALGQWENQSALARYEQQEKKFSNKINP
jgi:hypothetical protein